MRALLDTQALLWWFADDPSLSPAARRFMANTKNTLVVSAASAWEIATKVRIGRLPTAAALAADFEMLLRQEGFDHLDISVDHAIRAGQLPGSYRDPFDRMLIAQAQAGNMPLISNEELFDAYGIRRIW